MLQELEWNLTENIYLSWLKKCSKHAHRHRYVLQHTHTHRSIKCQCEVGCERQGKIRTWQAFGLFLLAPPLSLLLRLSRSSSSTHRIYLPTSVSLCPCEVSASISHPFHLSVSPPPAPYIFQLHLCRSLSARWALSFMCFKMAARARHYSLSNCPREITWGGTGYRMTWMQQSPFFSSDFSFLREVVVCALVRHPQPCNKEQDNEARWLQSFKWSATIVHNDLFIWFFFYLSWSLRVNNGEGR